jgi:hypothetical protein
MACARCGKKTAEVHTCTNSPYVAGLEAEIERLSEEAKLFRAAQKACDGGSAERDYLRDALARYGRHDRTCLSNWLKRAACNCGFDSIFLEKEEG